MPAFFVSEVSIFWYIAFNMMDDRIIDIRPLEEITGGDVIRMRKYIRIFLEGLPGYLDQINKAVTNIDSDTMYQVIHAIKPHVKMMGMVKLLPDIDQREKRFTSPISAEDLRAEAGSVIELLNEASEELRKFVQESD